jgi:hypothetical protein
MPFPDKPRRCPWLLALLATHGGCASAPRPVHWDPQPTEIAVSATTRLAPPARPERILPGPPESIYRNPRIGVVYLRAHQDAAGRLLGPQIMYQVVEPGGWNLQALESGDGYVPAANLEAPANTGSPLVVPAAQVPSSPADAPLLDPEAASRITITGLMDPGDRPEAEAMAGRAGRACAAVYDRQAGWLLVPVREP